MKALDLTNQRFGRLTVLYKCNYKIGKYYPWHCKCDCGNEKDVLTHYLRNGKTRSCGCLRKEVAQQRGLANRESHSQTNINDLINERFGMLIVLEREDVNDPSGKTIWKCQCDCGNTVSVRRDSLLGGNTTSCGCLKSKGQKKIAQILTKYNILFEAEKTFESCRNPKTGSKFRFDFYVNKQYIIEYDGAQHFKETSFFKQTLQEQQEKDALKNQWCKDNNVPLIRIPYTKLDTMTISDLKLNSTKFLM